MYCSKCKFTSFDHVPACPKCGYDWQQARTALNLGWLHSTGYEWFTASEEAEIEPAVPPNVPPNAPPEPVLLPEQETEDVLLTPSEASPLDEHIAPVLSTADAMRQEPEDQSPAIADHTVTGQPEQDTDIFQTVSDLDLPEPNPMAEAAEMEPPSLEVAQQSPSPSASPPAPPSDPPSALLDPDQSMAPEPSQDQDELPVWEIDVSDDVLSEDLFLSEAEAEDMALAVTPEPDRESTQDPDSDFTSLQGDIAYDFEEQAPSPVPLKPGQEGRS
jgi:hypothetical protein